MTLTDALTLKAGDTIQNKGMPDGPGYKGFPPQRFVITLATPARPDLGYAPGFVGWRDGDRATRNSVNLVLDGSPDCLRALAHWTIVGRAA